MKKTSIKFISGLLVIVMLAALLPISAAAKTIYEDTASPELNDLEHVLSIDNLGDTTNNLEGSDVTFTADAFEQGHNGIEGSNLITESVNSNSWLGYSGETNLPLNNNSKYVIEFDAKFYYEFKRTIFLFTTPGQLYQESTNGGVLSGTFTSKTLNNTPQGIAFTPETAYMAKGMTSTPDHIYNNYTKEYSDIDWKQTNKVIMVLNGSAVAVFVNNTLIDVFSIAVESTRPYAKASTGPSVIQEQFYLDEVLSFGVRVNADTTPEGTGTAYACIENINIYKGTIDVSPNFTDGESLIEIPHLNSTVNASTSEYANNITFTELERQAVVAGSDENITATGTGWVFRGYNTNLPLNAFSKYTIEFYMKKIEGSGNMGFCFTGAASNKAAGFYYYGASFTTIHGYTTNSYEKASTTGLSVYGTANNDGYTRFVIEIDGMVARTYSGNDTALNYLGEYDFTVKNPAANPSSGHQRISMAYSTDTLTLAFKASGASVLTDKPFAAMKDITVYAGNTMSDKAVTFEDSEGTVLQSGLYEKGTFINEFPTVDVAEGKVGAWFIKGTNVVALAPYEVVADVTIEHRIFDKTYSEVAAVQKTTPVGNVQNVRFIATLQDVSGITQAGFEIISYYDDGDGVKERPVKEENVKYIFNSVNVTVESTVTNVTAGELGGKYLIAIVVEDVPANCDHITFYVRSYVVTTSGEKIYCENTAAVSFINGIYDAGATPLTK